MKNKLTFFLIFKLFLFAPSSFGQISTNLANKIADKIYLIEGGAKTKHPYGVLSIKTSGNQDVARRICLNTIRNNYSRWQKSPKTNDFLTFLGNKYAPVGADNDKNNLNVNWIKNIHKLVPEKIE